MARYIDVENVDLETIHTSHMGYSTKADIADWLNEQPTADVEDVKHGYLTYNPFYIEFTCSVCGGTQKIKGKYCPHCGAKMDGGKVE